MKDCFIIFNYIIQIRNRPSKNFFQGKQLIFENFNNTFENNNENNNEKIYSRFSHTVWAILYPTKSLLRPMVFTNTTRQRES